MVLSKRKCMLCNSDEPPLFHFPKKPERFYRWLRAIAKEDLVDQYSTEYIYNNARLCSSHFNDSAFTSSLKKRLAFCSIPIDVRAPPPSTSVVQNCSDSFPPTSTLVQDLSIEVSAPSIPSTSTIIPDNENVNQLAVKVEGLNQKVFKKGKSSTLNELKSVLTSTQYDLVLSWVKAAIQQEDAGQPRKIQWPVTFIFKPN